MKVAKVLFTSIFLWLFSYVAGYFILDLDEAAPIFATAILLLIPLVYYLSQVRIRWVEVPFDHEQQIELFGMWHRSRGPGVTLIIEPWEKLAKLQTRRSETTKFTVEVRDSNGNSATLYLVIKTKIYSDQDIKKLVAQGLAPIPTGLPSRIINHPVSLAGYRLQEHEGKVTQFAKDSCINLSAGMTLEQLLGDQQPFIDALKKLLDKELRSYMRWVRDAWIDRIVIPEKIERAIQQNARARLAMETAQVEGQILSARIKHMPKDLIEALRELDVPDTEKLAALERIIQGLYTLPESSRSGASTIFSTNGTAPLVAAQGHTRRQAQ